MFIMGLHPLKLFVDVNKVTILSCQEDGNLVACVKMMMFVFIQRKPMTLVVIIFVMVVIIHLLYVIISKSCILLIFGCKIRIVVFYFKM